MKRSKLVIAALLALAVATVATTALANELTSENWRVFNAVPSTAYFWDINKAAVSESGGIQFPILDKSSGSYVVYLYNNYNHDLTGKAITASMSWTPASEVGSYVTRGTAAGAFVRFEFQDVTSGPYTSNDYWWSTNALDLNAASSGLLTASLSTPAGWTNLCGKHGDDTTVYSGPNCVGGTDPAVSPADGFAKAAKNVKQLGLAFGNSSRYASGVAADSGQATFTVTSYEVN